MPDIKHLHTGEEMCSGDIIDLLDVAFYLKKYRSMVSTALVNKHLALIFDKPSLRTRFSFTVAMRELGGDVVESVQTFRKFEEPEDQIRVLQGYCHAAMIRTHEDAIFEKMKSVAKIPIINGLSDLYHPCQILADLMTLREKFGFLKGLTISYLGDGNNILHSLITMAPKLGINLHYCCPEAHSPNSEIVESALEKQKEGSITAFSDPLDTVSGSQAVYTDVWTSMGFEPNDESAFSGYQVNEQLMGLADKDAVFLHCMPMNRGKEVSHSLPDSECSLIFQQSENRLHVQKALLYDLLS